MSLNINSISELNQVTELNTISAAAISNLTAVAQQYYGEPFEGRLNELGLNGISCNDAFVEVSLSTSSGYRSQKLNLGKILTDITKTLAWLAYLNGNGLTKDVADELYVPYAGNINGKPISGLNIVGIATGARTALQVDGYAEFRNSNRQAYFTLTPDTTLANCIVNVANGTLSSTNNAKVYFNKLSAVNSNLTSCTANNLSAVSYSEGSTIKYAIDGSSARSDNYTKLQLTKASAIELKADNLTADNLIAVNLSGGRGRNSSGEVFALKVPSNTGEPSAYIEHLLVNYNVKAAELSSTNLTGGPGNLVVQGNNTIEIENLEATNFTASNANISSISAGGKNGTAQLQISKDDNFVTLENLHATNLSAGIATNKQLLIVNSLAEYITLNQLQVTNGLSALNKIAELTAKAACWS